MPKILHIETSTKVCSVAVSQKGGQLLAVKESDDISHSQMLTVFIREVLKQAEIDIKQLDAVALSKGPGSYTGLRIGASAAKGLCYALDIPLIAISTLKSLAHAILQTKHVTGLMEEDRKFLLCPMIDARRMEVYSAFFDPDLNIVRETSADIIDENSYVDLLEDHNILFFGTGALKCKPVLRVHPGTYFVDHFPATAKGLISLAHEKYQRNQFEEAVFFEPFYLKEFQAGK